MDGDADATDAQAGGWGPEGLFSDLQLAACWYGAGGWMHGRTPSRVRYGGFGNDIITWLGSSRYLEYFESSSFYFTLEYD